MNKTVRKITAILSAGLISASLICSISSSAYIEITPNNSDTWNTSSDYGSSRCVRKYTDSSIYVWTQCANSGAYISIYGNNSGQRKIRCNVSSCDRYWGSLTTTDIYVERNSNGLIRNYVNENNYKYAVLKATKAEGDSYGGWKTDLYGYTYGAYNLN